MSPLRNTALTLSAALCLGVMAQTPGPMPAPQTTDASNLRNTLPPSTILEQTLQPFDAVRADMANWSDTEQKP